MITSLMVGDHPWELFAKKQSELTLIWDDLVRPYYNTDLVCETWGRPYMASYCPSDGPSCLNVLTINVTANVSWTHKQDHSKYCISSHRQEGDRVVCFGDQNRMESQRNSAGAAICIPSMSLW